MAPSLSTIYAGLRLCRNYRNRQHEAASQTPEGESSADHMEVRCIYCARKERLLTFRQLKRGDHICMGGARFQFNLGTNQIHAYTHHAIVKKVEFIDESKAILTMIHFMSTLYDKEIKIQETREVKNVFNDEIYVIKYRHQTRQVDNIIERAESLIGQDIRYTLLERNCEAFAHWCVIGQEQSCQALSFCQFLRDLFRNCNNVVTSFIFRHIRNMVLVSIDDVAGIITACNIAAPIAFAISTILYAMYCKYMIKKLEKKRDDGQMCLSCFSDHRCEIWVKFGAFVTPQLLGFIAIPVMGWGATATIAVCSILSLGLMWGLPKLHKKIRTPFRGKKLPINWLRKIWIGDVVSFNYCGMSHDGIVSAVNVLPRTRGRKGYFKIIHYALPGMLSRREIREDEVYIDLSKTYLELHDYSGYDMHAPEEVVDRARMRIGETKFGIFSNRSCHFCDWAKIKEAEPTEEMPYQEQRLDYVRSLRTTDAVTTPVYVDHRRGARHATTTLPPRRAIIRDDVTKGQLIQFKYGTFWHKAICTNVKPGRRQSVMVVSLVHYGRNYTATEESMVFDLRHQDIYIYNYHPLYRYRPDEVIRWAREKIGEQKYNLCTRRSSHLAEEAICKNTDKLASRLDEIRKGHVIIYRYWSLKHEAVVSDVIIDDAKTNAIGSIKIIHYALASLFGTREIIEEKIRVNLQHDEVYIKMFHGYATYPTDMVVKRARSRVGERRFHCRYNTSFDFVHWATVIQQPSVVSVTPVDEDGNVNAGTGEEVILLPRVGNTCEQFHVDWVKTWDELKPGLVIEYRYYMIWHRGIVSQMHPDRNKVNVIHYGTANLFSKRTIMEDTISIDLKVDRIWVYRCDPAKCNPLHVVVRKAKARLGEQDWKRGNRSWDFCKACTLKN